MNKLAIAKVVLGIILILVATYSDLVSWAQCASAFLMAHWLINAASHLSSGPLSADKIGLSVAMLAISCTLAYKNLDEK